MWLLKNETNLKKGTLLIKVLHLPVILFSVISIRSYTLLHTILSNLETTPEVIL
jgi:hypothetical protein